MDKTCSVEGCEGRAIARGWCRKHYTRWDRYGDPLYEPPPPPKANPCTVEGCTNPQKSRGWCQTHYRRFQRHGDPLHVKRIRGAGPSRAPVVRDPVQEGNKRCRRCGLEKPLDDFYTRKSGHYVGQPMPYCKPCWQAINRDMAARDPERTKILRRSYSKAYRLRHLERVREKERKANVARREVKYGLTPGQFAAMLEAQGGACAICLKPCPSGKSLAVDHDHTTGAVRALLCIKCNQGIGQFDDNPQLLQAAIRYLKSHAPEGV